jgi:DNA repair exonuclease SbcCD ATPase subunit
MASALTPKRSAFTISSSPRRTPTGVSHVITISTPTRKSAGRKLFEDDLTPEQQVQQPESSLTLEYDPEQGFFKTLLMYLKHLFSLPVEYFKSLENKNKASIQPQPLHISVEPPAQIDSVVEIKQDQEILKELAQTRIENTELKLKFDALTEEHLAQSQAMSQATKSLEKSDKSLTRALESKSKHIKEKVQLKEAFELQIAELKQKQELEKHQFLIQLKKMSEDVARLNATLNTDREKNKSIETQLKQAKKTISELQRSSKTIVSVPAPVPASTKELEDLRTLAVVLSSKLETVSREKQSLVARNNQLVLDAKQKKTRTIVAKQTTESSLLAFWRVVIPFLMLIVAIMYKL